MAMTHAESLRGKFLHVTVASGPVIYAAEFCNGMVKVGYTRNARPRMCAVAGHARHDYGVKIVNFHVSKPHPTEALARKSEYALLLEMGWAGGECLPGRTEFFRGVSFEKAVALCEAVALEQISAR